MASMECNRIFLCALALVCMSRLRMYKDVQTFWKFWNYDPEHGR